MSFQLKTQHSHHEQTIVCGDGCVLVTKVIPITLDLFDPKQSPTVLDFQDNSSEIKRKRGVIDNQHYKCEEIMSMNRKNGNSKLDLKLNLSPPSSRMLRQESPSRSSASVSPPSSCVSTELSSPEACSMVLLGCPSCLMYVMLSQDDPKCPKCKSTVLLDFLHDDTTNKNHNCTKKSTKS